MTVATLSTYTGNRMISSAATTNADFAASAANTGWLGERDDAAQINRWLLKFAALSDGTIPATATVTAASIFIYANGDYSANARDLEVYRPIRAWSASQSTWNNYITGNAWTTAGCSGVGTDYNSTLIGSKSLTASEALNVYKEIPITASYIQSFVDGTWTNNGFLLKMNTETSDAYRYNSSVTNEANLPYMTVTYDTDDGKRIMMF